MHQLSPFQFDIEAELFEKKNSRGETETWVGGVCTTDHQDQEEETLLQTGLDFGPFLDHGFLNDNHDKQTGGAVGIPQSASLRKLPDGHTGWYIEAKLLDNKRAEEIKDLARALEHSGDGKRKLGFSVEGSILERDPEDPSLVRRAVVREVAITRCPVNKHTTLTTLAKSLAVGNPAGSPGGMRPLQVESLEGMVPGPHVNFPKKKKKKKKMNKSEAVAFLMGKHKGLTRERAEHIVGYALRNYAA